MNQNLVPRVNIIIIQEIQNVLIVVWVNIQMFMEPYIVKIVLPIQNKVLIKLTGFSEGSYQYIMGHTENV